MASADIIACIHSALEVVDLLVKRSTTADEKTFLSLRCKLISLKTVVLCSRKLDSCGNLSYVLGRIEDIVNTYAGHIRDRCLRSDNGFGDHYRLAFAFEEKINSLKDEIDEWYLTVVADNAPKKSTTVEVLEIITSTLENLADFRSLIQLPNNAPLLVDTSQALEEQMSFLKSLVRFVSTRSDVESLECLLAHVQAVTINASLLLFRARYVSFYSQDKRSYEINLQYFYPYRGFGYQQSYVTQDSQPLLSEMSVLVQKMKPIDSYVYDIYTRALSGSAVQSRFLEDDVAMGDFLNSLISIFCDILRIYSSSDFMMDLQEVYDGLVSVRTILKQEQLSLGGFLCDAGLFICSLQHTHHEEQYLVLNNFLHSIWRIMPRIGAAKKADLPAGNQEQEGSGVEIVSPTYRSRIPSQGVGVTSAPNQQALVGFHDEQKLILEQLIRDSGSKKLRIVAIVGMPGLGKTTLASRIYNNSELEYRFLARGWSPVSQVLNKKKVMLDLLNQIDPNKSLDNPSEQDIANELRKSLKGKRYLIFLDDVWDIEAWNLLKESFPDDNVGSRIILTSRRSDVAPHKLMFDEKPHDLRLLNEEESMELLRRKILFEISIDHGMKIAEKCRGLPLLIVVVAGILNAVEPESWNKILDGLRNVSTTDVQCRNTLELSYHHLPDCLKPCLLYFGAFREDEEVSVRRLVRLWIAEGFVQKDGAAEGYLNDLICRSLLMVVKRRSDGGVKTCRIHDLLHDFCIQKAKDEHLLHVLKGYDELSLFNEVNIIQRLCIHSKVEHFKQFKLFCPRARSLNLCSSQSQSSPISMQVQSWADISFAIQMFKHLTVLNLEQFDLGVRFPTEVEHLVQLGFLSIRCDTDIIPSLIGNLLKLQTFIIQHGGVNVASFPDSLWNLQKLQYLYITSQVSYYRCKGGGHFPMDNIESSPSLHELESLSGAVIPYSKLKSLLTKFPNMRNLKVKITDESLLYRKDLVVPDVLSRLESLNMISGVNSRDPYQTFDKFSMPACLKKLTLGGMGLSWRNLSTIGELPNLEILKLVWINFEGETWEMKEGEFSQLRILKLVDLDFVRWVTEFDDQLDCLEKLVLRGKLRLEEIPASCLGTIPTLKVIEVSGCRHKTVELVRQIEETQKELMGESDLKIITSKIW